MSRSRLAKIVATLGPASRDEATIRALFDAGADVFRLNFSHGTHAEQSAAVRAIRRIEAEAGRPVGILQDLQGPKLRIGRFQNGEVRLQRGARFDLDLVETRGDTSRVCLPHPEVFSVLRSGTSVLLDDGKLRLEVEHAGNDHAVCRVVTGGVLSDRKGVNVPGAIMPVSPITEQDREDLAVGLQMGVDWVALSFVQHPRDVREARELIGDRARLMVKVEKPAALEYLDDLVNLADAVMVARGDLGVEVAPEHVPGHQKRIVRACRLAGKPVIVATQMLDSMVEAPSPTRAEASDVATAVYDGADAVMLSAETAAGYYPVESVGFMDRIVGHNERDTFYRPIITALDPEPEPTSPDAISAAAAQVATTISAAAIVTYTTHGATTLRAARERPTVPVIALTSRQATARAVTLVWGAYSVQSGDVRDFQEMVDKATTVAVNEGFAGPGEQVVITAGVPFGTPGATNVLRIAGVPHTASLQHASV